MAITTVDNLVFTAAFAMTAAAVILIMLPYEAQLECRNVNAIKLLDSSGIRPKHCVYQIINLDHKRRHLNIANKHKELLFERDKVIIIARSALIGCHSEYHTRVKLYNGSVIANELCVEGQLEVKRHPVSKSHYVIKYYHDTIR